MPHVHTYATTLTWAGSTAAGYRGYGRAHEVRMPAGPELTVSADPSFRGDPGLVNPEQLVLAAASSCQMLSFLAEAARAGIDVRSYTDEAEAVMPVADQPMRLTRIVLRPRIGVAPGTDESEVLRLVDAGHHGCFIANSLRSEIVIEATIEQVGDPG